MNNQRWDGRWTILVFMALAWWCVPLATVAEDQNRVGECIVRLNLSCNGSASSITSSDGITATSKDAFSGTVTSEVRYEVIQMNPETFGTGDEIGGSSSVSVSGGGTGSIKSKDGQFSATWTYSPDPDFDSTVAYASGTFESGSDPDLTPNAWAGRGESPAYQFKITPDNANPWTVAAGAASDAVAKLEDFEFEIPAKKEGWTRNGSHSAQVSRPSVGGAVEGSASVSVTIEFIPDQASPWEAIIEGSPGAKPEYKDWVPQGGSDDTDENPGNMLPVHVYIRAKDGSNKIAPLAKYSFFLKDVSREPGISMNFPHRSVPAYLDDAERPFDLRIRPADQMTPSEVGQFTETDEMVVDAAVGINSYDYGAYGKLRVIAQTSDGSTLVAHPLDQPDIDFLTIPRDDNLNHVADAWEKQTNVYALNLREDSNRTISTAYAGQAADGDGISFYEKYRGFMVSFDGTRYAFERLDPHLKYLFIRNPDGLVASTFGSAAGLAESYPAAASCQIRYVDNSGWTGWGSFEDHKRIVNFNSTQDKHAIDQHALYVVLDPSQNPADPQQWIAFLNSLGIVFNEPFTAGTEGATYPDATGPAAFRVHMRPAYTYEVVIYGAEVSGYVTRCVRHHSAADLVGKTAAEKDQIVLDYMGAHAADASLKRLIEMSATIAHELGHGTGVIHHAPVTDSPTEPDLANCTMRYYSPNEFSVNPSDRFELRARGNEPSQFCRKKHNCWGQLAIDDDPAAPASTAVALASALTTEWSVQRQPAPRQSQLVPVLSISADLVWPILVEGDPMRIWARLHGPTTGMASNWCDGFQFTLRRIAADGQRQTILTAAGFKPFVQPLLFDTADLGLTNPTLIREWLVTPAAAQLMPGKYALEIAWNGTGFTAISNLPSDGLIQGSEIEFEVQPADNNAALGQRHRHLAWLANAQGDSDGVLAHGREAAKVDPDSNDPLALQTVFLMSSAALRENDPMSAARILNTVNPLPPGSSSHLVDVARGRYELLAPSIKVGNPGTDSTKTQLEIQGLPNRRYLLERSLDLKTWTTVSTNILQQSTLLVEDTKATPGTNRFYRLKWIK